MALSERELTAIGRSIRELLIAEVDAADMLRVVRSQLLERVTVRQVSADCRPRRRRATWRPRWAIVGGCLTAATAAILLLYARTRPISFQVGASGAPGRLGDVIEATGAAPAAGDVPVSLRSSEGSSIVLRDGRARVLATDRTGARVLVESGAVHVTITHRDRHTARWRFELGPYRVLVTDDPHWSPAPGDLLCTHLIGRMPRCRDICTILVVATVAAAGCEPSVAPIDVAQGCPEKPLRGPAEWATAPADRLIDDFEDGNLTLAAVAGRNGAWTLGVDGTSGVVTTEASSRCVARGNRAGHFAGGGFDTWQPNWTAVLKSANSAGTAVPFDARGYRAISFWAAAGGTVDAPLVVPLGLTTMDVAWNSGGCTTCMDYYATMVVLDGSWRRYVIPFAMLKQSGWGVPQVALRPDQLVGFIVWPMHDRDFDIWIDDVRLEP